MTKLVQHYEAFTERIETKVDEMSRKLKEAGYYPPTGHGPGVSEMPISDEITLIQMQGFSAECWVCGDECDHKYGIPVWEDLVLPNNYRGEWGGVPACERCYELQQKLLCPINQIEFLARSLALTI